ncbi:MAG: polysaccharide deacetylase family protein [Lachnospiraceae bacterium]|nr:polysaccharide deacetylase family protein [Lachnospiraceae bacterium]
MKKLFLTFDDGPSAEYTLELLNLLDEAGIKATFFVVGEFAKAHPEIIEEEIKRGHQVCLHANRHISSWLMTRKTYTEDMDTALETLEGMGIRPHYYRPPWGMTRRFSRYEASKRHMHLIKWDVMAEDWRAHTTPSEICRKILDRSFPGAVICLHDGRGRNNAPSRTIEALRTAIPKLKERGYTFETL